MMDGHVRYRTQCVLSVLAMQGLHVMDVRLRQCLCVRMRRGSVHDLAIVQSQELHHCFVTRRETRIVVCVSVDVGVCV